MGGSSGGGGLNVRVTTEKRDENGRWETVGLIHVAETHPHRVIFFPDFTTPTDRGASRRAR